MFSYNIYTQVSEKEFNEACKLIEVVMPDIKKEKCLEDVDGTQIQIYYYNDKKIKVVNDYEVDAVYIDSEIILDMLN